MTSTSGHVTITWLLTAITISMDDSVTVSMGLLTDGVFRVSFFVKAEVRSCKMEEGERKEGRREGRKEGRKEREG